MSRRVPVIPTIIVIAAALTMMGLGVWQLGRKAEKEALIARYQAAISNPEEVDYPAASQAAVDGVLYRRSSIDCAFTSGDWQSISGRNSKGQSAFVHIVLCGIDRGVPQADQTAYVQIGWSRDPLPPKWEGGPVSGWIVPNSEGFGRLVADPPLAGLGANAKPDPGDLPNNHLAYAGQWFFFALTALVIYMLALRRRRR